MRKLNSSDILRAFPFKTIFILLPFLYGILYAPYGFGSHDTGYILGLSWQLVNGSIPYSEILAVRPPASYFFHSITLLFGNYSVIADRLLFYFQVAIYSYLAISLMASKFKLDNTHYIYFIASISFILSVHTFPPMGWHTVDGIFFSVLGVYLIVNNKKTSHIYIGSIFLTFAALSKQPFYLTPVLLLGYVFLQESFKVFIRSFFTLVISVGAFSYYLYVNDSLSDFLRLTTGQTELSELIYIGFVSYFKEYKSFIFVLLPPATITIAISIFKKKLCLRMFFFFLFYWILAFTIYEYTNNEKFVPPVSHFADALFATSLLVVLYKLSITNENKYYLVLILLGISWSSGISWGYPTVVLFSAPSVFVISLLIYNKFNYNNYRLLSIGLLFLSLLTYYVGYQNPYNLNHHQKKSDIRYDMAEIYPRLKYIKGDGKTYLEYQELKSHILSHNKNFTVFPAATLIHYLSNTPNPIGIDWVLNAEINGEYQEIIDLLESKETVVFVRNEKINEEGKWGSFISLYIRNNWDKIGNNKFYDTYVFKPLHEQ